MIKISSWKL